MSVQSNLKECKDCKLNGVTTMVLWMQNPANPSKRMPADYKTLLETGQHVRHKCPYWKPTGTGTGTGTAAGAPQQQQVPLQPQPQTPQVPPPKLGQTTLPTGGELKLDTFTQSIFTNIVLALQEISDKLGTMNEYLEILANKEVKANVGIKSALQAKTDIGRNKDFDPRYCDHDFDGTVNADTGICTNCGTSFPAFKIVKEEEEEQQEFPEEDQLEEVKPNRLQRDPDAFPEL